MIGILIICLTSHLLSNTIDRFVFLSVEAIIKCENECVCIYKLDMFNELDMNNLIMNRVSILDLPSEVLLIILKKLSTMDVFYSIIDVNRTFYKLSLDRSHVRDLEITVMRNVDTCYKQISPIDTTLLSRLCISILPKIHHQVQKLTVDQSSMIPVLHAANYPQLYSLTIIDIQEEFLRDCLTSMLFLFYYSSSTK